MIQSTGIVRQRGQLTIPDSIREKRTWITPGSVVMIKSDKPNQIIIQPHREKTEIDWDQLWRDIRRVQSYKGKGRGNLSQFIAQDRQTRR